jgi:hypothetical protein
VRLTPSKEVGRNRDPHERPAVIIGLHGGDLADGIDVALHDMAAKTGGQGHRSLEVHERSGLEIAKCGAIQGLLAQVEGER